MMEKVNKTLSEWQNQLSDEQYYVTRLHGTERPYTGQYWDSLQKGIYLCCCCEQPLFSSVHKFISHCGWASFYQPIDDECVTEVDDFSHGMHRIETLCTRCDAHLGHVFNDAPHTPTGLRYCINSASLIFQAQEEI